MKLKFKMAAVAVAVAVASLAGGAQAQTPAWTTGDVVNNGTMSLLAFNEVTNAWYLRNLGWFINDFIPSGITTRPGDGSVTGDKTPEAGLVIDGSVKSNFSDPAFATWLTGQNIADVRWMVGSYDQTSRSTLDSQRRMIATSKNPAQPFTNNTMDTFVSSGGYGGMASFFNNEFIPLNPGGISKNGTDMGESANDGWGASLDLDTLGTVNDSQSLFYVVRSAFSGSGSNQANITRYGNSENFATMTLFANGELVYALAPAAAAVVPLPPALWMMGAGLVAMGGMVRRRRAAAALQA